MPLATPRVWPLALFRMAAHARNRRHASFNPHSAINNPQSHGPWRFSPSANGMIAGQAVATKEAAPLFN
jgi:hypothetical protein